jgi:subtilisin family serine protease
MHKPAFRRITPIRLTFLTLAFVFGFFGSGRIVAQSASSPAGDEMMSVYVLLRGEPTMSLKREFTGKRPEAVAAARARKAQLDRQQNEVRSRLLDLGATESARFHKLVNGMRVKILRSRLDQLKNIPGVVSVQPSRIHQRHLQSSVPFIGTPAAWSGIPGADGNGVRIGIIDSGIDYYHADFGGSGNPDDWFNEDPTVIEPGSFPTAKVVGGFDFAGDDYDGDNAPIPDLDPVDCGGHGSHVAGIAAGLGVNSDGSTFTGPYNDSINFANFLVGPGVAPRASLYALKVFGCEGGTQLVLEALEWAADPNDDDDFSDRLDVVNMSLGSDFGFDDPLDAELGAVNRLSELGCVVAISAGNAGNTFYVVGSPGTAKTAITVANTTGPGHPFKAIEVKAPAGIAGLYAALEGDFTAPLRSTGDIEGSLVYVNPADACGPLTNPGLLAGKIALIDRGTCFFADKIQKVQDAGAIAAIVVNNVDEPPFVMSGDSPATIPGVLISRADGALLKANLATARVRLSDSLSLTLPSIIDLVSSSSSRGPLSPFGALKPDISAPGVDIFSADVGGGSAGVSKTGTSMAAPHVAGAAALLKQLHPGWPVADIKAALMNTAETIHNSAGILYPESRVGSGRIDVSRAVRAIVTATRAGDPGAVSVSLGFLELTTVYTNSFSIELTNHGSVPMQYSISISNTVARRGFQVLPRTAAVTVPGNQAALVEFVVAADPSQFDDALDATTPETVDGISRQRLLEASGEIWFHNAALPLHVPYHAAVRAATDSHIGASQFGIPADKSSFTVRLTPKGIRTNPEAVGSAFQLLAVSANQNSPNRGTEVGDLLAVGAASDVAVRAQFSDALVYFAVAVATNWTTPQDAIDQIDVFIDTNKDGIDDFQVFNANLEDFKANVTNVLAASDVFVVIVENLKTHAYSTNRLVNFFPFASRDTALFNNSVLILPVPVKQLGLSATNPSFKLRVETHLPYNLGGSKSDSTGALFFDASKPVFDVTAGSPTLTPYFSEQDGFNVVINRAAAIQQNITDVARLLVFHHFNTDGKHFEIVDVDLLNPDTDQDTIPDLWELTYFPDLLPGAPGSDFDRDGFNDRDEFLAGTNPNNASSLLKLNSSVIGQQIRLSWPSVSGRTYRILRGTDILSGFSSVVADNIPATPPTNSITDSAANPSSFYRVELK